MIQTVKKDSHADQQVLTSSLTIALSLSSFIIGPFSRGSAELIAISA